MKVARLYGPKDIRIDDQPEPPPLAKGEVLLRITAVGLCGSDLHTYEDGHIGDTYVESPLILGHEFAGEILTLGESSVDGNFQPLHEGQRVAVDPTTPCYHCELCETGHPNLCPNHTFMGLFPYDGALQEKMIVPARNCFPIPDSLSDAAGALLETLGVAVHAVDLGKLQVAKSVAILGCGPIGLLILRLAALAGAAPIYAFDCFPWRVEKARAWGATAAWTVDEGDPVALVREHTGGRGTDVVFEAAWADHSIQQAAEMARYGGRLVLVGIPGDDNLRLKHSTVRRKGLTIMVCRRMKHTYPRAIRLATIGKDILDLDELVSHRFPLEETSLAFQTNAAYQPGSHKVLIDLTPNNAKPPIG